MLSHHWPSHLCLFSPPFFPLHQLPTFASSFPPSAPGLSDSTVLLKGQRLHTHLWNFTLTHDIVSKQVHQRAIVQRGVLAWSECNGFIFLWVINTTIALLAPFILQINAVWKITENCMQSQYSVRMPCHSIDGVCVWENTHKSWFLESVLMMDILSVWPCALTCQENLEPALFLPLCWCACKRALIKSH